EKAMRQRNRLLEEGGDPLWLNAIEAQMAQLASAIHFARSDSLTQLRKQMAESIAETGFPEARLDVTPLFEDGSVPEASSALEEKLALSGRANRARDRAAGRTLWGPHRADLSVTHTAKDMPASLCSTGEQKALLIGLVLVHARLVTHMSGIVPILLLD